MSARSAIEMMVDRACGIPDGFREAQAAAAAAINGRDADGQWLILRCPQCSSVAASERSADYFDPPTATLVESCCPECNGGDLDSPQWFDAAGRDLTNAALDAVEDKRGGP